jgi:hypothetical protein
MSRLAQAFARKHGRPDARFWVDHTPANIMHARTVLELFPESSLIHLVRDPRAVAASVLPLDWGPASAREAAGWWLTRVAAGLAAESAYPGRVHRVHYEDVVGDPGPALERLVTALALPPDDGSADRGPQVPTYTRAQHRLVSQPPDAERISAWRSALSPRQIETIEAEVGDTLALLGYEPLSAAVPARPRVTAGETLQAGWRRGTMRMRRAVRRRRAGAG